MRYDPAEIAALENPYPHYARLREAGPVVRGGPATWAVTRYSDVAALCADQRLSHEFPPTVYQVSGEPDSLAEFFATTVLNRDPPAHTMLRRPMAKLVSPREIARMRPRIDELVDDIFAGMREREQVDVVEDLAFPLPVVVAAELLGIPLSERDEVRPYAVELGRAFSTGIEPGMDRTAAVEALAWLRQYVRDLLTRRTDDENLISALIAAQEGQRISRAELIDNIIFLFFAGFDTTTNLLATGCAQIMAQPSLLEELRADPSLAGSAAEEFLRYDSPIQATARFTKEEITVAGRLIRQQRVVILMLGSANHDPEHFPDPEKIILNRSPNPHLGFSAGVHHCLGAVLARAEATSVFRHIACHVTALAPDGEPKRRLHSSFRGYERIPVIVR
jgi:cytochrome P450